MVAILAAWGAFWLIWAGVAGASIWVGSGTGAANEKAVKAAVDGLAMAIVGAFVSVAWLVAVAVYAVLA